MLRLKQLFNHKRHKNPNDAYKLGIWTHIPYVK